jgi:hypothetical protein
MHTFLNELSGPWLIVSLFIIMIASIWAGMLVAKLVYRKKHMTASNAERLIGAFFALAAFVLAFSFSMSAQRHDSRREAIISEANAIGTALLRADLYPDSVRRIFRQQFSDYLESRLRFFNVGPNYDSALYYVDESAAYGLKIWHTAAIYARFDRSVVPTGQMVPSINEMLDAATTRHARLLAKVPEPMLYLLLMLIIFSAFFAGYTRGEEKIDKLVSLVFCMASVAVVYMVIDFDRPRRGVIKLDATHKVMTDLRSLLDPSDQ